jgi:hypothetical protein
MEETQLKLNNNSYMLSMDNMLYKANKTFSSIQFKQELLDRNIITETSSVHKNQQNYNKLKLSMFMSSWKQSYESTGSSLHCKTEGIT